MNNDKLLETFRDTAIKCHIGFNHQGPWEACEWVECEDRKEMIESFAPPESTREQWRQGMRDAAKEVCDACDNEERYGPARKIEGSTRWWHGDDNIPCEAGGIWHALAESTITYAVAPADNDALEVCRLLSTLDWVVGYELAGENQTILDRAQELALKVMGMSDPPTPKGDR